MIATVSPISSGCTSGVGLAIAKTTASRAMVPTAAAENAPGADTPTTTSAPRSASSVVPVMPRGLVRAASAAVSGVRSVRPGCSTPPMSHTTMSRTPSASMISAHAWPAAPAPTTTTRTSAIRLPTTRSALSSAASTTIAVPCWSSWNTGISSSARRRRSISKQRGAAMSSRLMPPKVGATPLTISTMVSTSVVSRHSGNASTPASSLKSMALPSMTGIAAFGPTLPRPSTAVPSDTTATVEPLTVSAHAASGSRAMASETRATPGV